MRATRKMMAAFGRNKLTSHLDATNYWTPLSNDNDKNDKNDEDEEKINTLD